MADPVAQRWVRRDELLELLLDARLVLFGAPGGYGKTTTAEQLLAAWGLGAVRFRAHEPTSLEDAVHALARSVRRAGLGDLANAMRDEVTADPAGALDRFVSALNERALPLAVFLDDVHWLEPAAAGAVVSTLADLAPSAKVVIAGRDLGVFEDLARDARSVHIGVDGLRFDDREVAGLLGEDATNTIVAELLEATTGWCAAAALAAQRLRLEPSWSPRGAGGRALLEDLVATTAARLPGFSALSTLALVDEAVAEIAGGVALFDAARRAGMLVHQHGRWWAVPDPIREVVAADDTLTDAERAAIAQHYDQYGEVPAAIAVLRRGSASGLVRFLAGLHWTDLEAIGVGELLTILAGLADDDLEVAPELLLAVARAVELTAPDHRAPLLARLDRLESVAPAILRASMAETARDLSASAHLDESVELARRVLAEGEPDEAVARARALSVLARVEVFSCSSDGMARGAEFYDQAARLFRDAGETRWLAETLARRGYTALYMGGRPADGEREMHAALALLPAGDATRAFWLTNYSDVLDYLGRSFEAEAAATEALEIGRRRQDPNLQGMAWWSLSWVAAHRGDVAAFHSAIEGFERVAGDWIRPGQLVEFLGSTAEQLAMLGDPGGCDAYIARAWNAPAAVDYPTPIELAEARRDALHGDAEHAAAMLERLERGVALVPSNRPLRVVLRGLAEARSGRVDEARALLDEAKAASAALGVSDLLVRYAGAVLRTLDELVASDTDRADELGTSSHLRLLGGFALDRAGVQCTPQPGYPALLVKLVALHGVMTVDAAVDAVWPDVDPTTARARLRNTLSRLKQRSGDVVVRDAETLRLGDEVRCDLTVFEQQASAALSATGAARVGPARSAMALYGGELLPGDVYEEWTLGPRERARRRFLALVDVAADDAIARDDTEEALRLLDLGITAEPLDTRRYAVMCELLTARGRTRAAREVAERAIAVLDDIGEPADERLLELAGR